MRPLPINLGAPGTLPKRPTTAEDVRWESVGKISAVHLPHRNIAVKTNRKELPRAYFYAQLPHDLFELTGISITPNPKRIARRCFFKEDPISCEDNSSFTKRLFQEGLIRGRWHAKSVESENPEPLPKPPHHIVGNKSKGARSLDIFVKGTRFARPPARGL